MQASSAPACLPCALSCAANRLSPSSTECAPNSPTPGPRPNCQTTAATTRATPSSLTRAAFQLQDIIAPAPIHTSHLSFTSASQWVSATSTTPPWRRCRCRAWTIQTWMAFSSNRASLTTSVLYDGLYAICILISLGYSQGGLMGLFSSSQYTTQYPNQRFLQSNLPTPTAVTGAIRVPMRLALF